MSKDTGWKSLQRERDYMFEKWGEYMKRANLAERKLEKLKALLLLTDPAVENMQMNKLTALQWSEFIKEFKDEGASNE